MSRNIKSPVVLQNQTFTKKFKVLTLLQRNHRPQRDEKDEVKDERLSQRDRTQIVEKGVLQSLSMFKTLQLESMTLYSTLKICDSLKFALTKMAFLLSENASRRSQIQICYTSYIQQGKKMLHDPYYWDIPKKIVGSPQLVENSEAKTILFPTRKKLTTTPITKTPEKLPEKKRNVWKLSNLRKTLKTKPAQLNWGNFSETDQRKLASIYRRGPFENGSVTNLRKETKLTREKVVNFISSRNAHVKCRNFCRRFPRLKVFAEDNEEILKYGSSMLLILTRSPDTTTVLSPYSSTWMFYH